MKSSIRKILFVGGGTGGSVTPLLALAVELKLDQKYIYDFLFVGTKFGPEKDLVIKENIKFKTIVSGKLRRYLALKNFIDPFKIIFGFFQAFIILISYRPNLVIGAGSFVAVPVALAAWILRIPVITHQQDVRPGLANKIMAPFSRVITVTFSQSLKDYGQKAILTGNPIKIDKTEINVGLSLRGDLPLILVIGGGTGSVFLNNLLINSLSELTKFSQIIHIAGKGKLSSKSKADNYYPFEFMDHARLFKIMELADIAVSRCGLGVLTELCYLAKPSILIPMPNSHQEDNARIFQEQGAALVLAEANLTPELFLNQIKNLLDNKKLREDFRSLIKGVIKAGNNNFSKIIDNLLK